MYMPENRRYIYESGVGRETFDLCVDLLCNGKSGVCCKISAPALAAEDAAFFAQGAVTVGTGHAAV